MTCMTCMKNRTTSDALTAAIISPEATCQRPGISKNDTPTVTPVSTSKPASTAICVRCATMLASIRICFRPNQRVPAVNRHRDAALKQGKCCAMRSRHPARADRVLGVDVLRFALRIDWRHRSRMSDRLSAQPSAVRACIVAHGRVAQRAYAPRQSWLANFLGRRLDFLSRCIRLCDSR